MSEKRLIIATVLSTAVILLWWMWYLPKQAGQMPAAIKPAVTMGEVPENKIVHEEARPKERTETIETDRVRVVFAGRGARITHYFIKEGKDASKYVDMILPPAKVAFEPKIFETFPGANFKVVRKTTDSITFAVIVNGVGVTKEFIFNPNNLNELKINFKNNSSASREVNLQTSWGPGVGCNVEHRKEETLLMRVVTASYAQKGKYVINKLAPGQYFLSKYAWLGMDNRYFCVIMLNPCAPLFCSHFDQISVSKVTDEKLFEVNLSTRIVLAAGARTGFSIPFYIGPKDYTQLTKLGYGMREIVDFGFFAELAKFAFHSLRYLYRITGNYGVAIILLTIIIQALFYPLTVKSYKASAGMKLLQPKIKEIQQKIGNDPKRMNAEMLNLYKTQKVNPLGGCLPLLIQMPIFWALFVTLRNIYELRQAPFILWIKDLSAPDMLFSAFGFPVRLLPLFMGISMYVQQTLSGASTDPSQKMLVYLMPVMFTFIFWNFPSGLVLYWLINNVVTIGVQYTITKKQAAHEKFASKVIDAEVIDARGLKKP